MGGPEEEALHKWREELSKKVVDGEREAFNFLKQADLPLNDELMHTTLTCRANSGSIAKASDVNRRGSSQGTEVPRLVTHRKAYYRQPKPFRLQ